MSAANLARAASPSRVAELEDPLNRAVYHPLAFALARALQPTPVTPNMVSVLSAALICIAGILYTRMGWPAGAVAGFACHLAWHVADGADGDLARLTGRSSPLGEFIDGAADYLGHIVLYVLLAAVLDDQWGAWAWLLAVLSGCSRIAQANHAETQRRQYLWRVYGVPWLKTQQAAGKRVFAGGTWVTRAAAAVMRGYIALGALMAPRSAPLDRVVAEAAGQPARLASIRQRIRAASRGSIALQKALGANPRTVLLGLSMLAGSPVWYFLFEAVVLNVVLAASLAHHNRVERRLIAELG